LLAAPPILPLAPAALPTIAPLEQTAAKFTPASAAPAEARPSSSETQAAASSAFFDARAVPIEIRMSFIMEGFRIEDGSHRLLAPNGGAALTVDQWRGYGKFLREARLRKTLLLLADLPHAAVGTPREARRQALWAANRDILPAELSKAAGDPERERPVILRRLASLYRRGLQRPVPTAFQAPAPITSQEEEKLGGIFETALVARLEKSPEGRRLLASLTDADGARRLPAIRVLRFSSDGEVFADAFYSTYGRQLFFSLDTVRAVLVARLSANERAEADAALRTQKGALQFFENSPARAAAFVEAVEETLFHELVHYEQDRQLPLPRAALHSETPPLIAVEQEYDAYFRQNQYLRGVLEKDGSRVDFGHIDDYQRLLEGFDVWKAHIDRAHLEDALMSGMYTTLADLARLHAFSRALLERLAGPKATASPEAAVLLAAARRGSEAIEVEQKAAQAKLEDFRATWGRLEESALIRWAALSRRHGNWAAAAAAQDRLAATANESVLMRRHRAKADADAHFALLRLHAPVGLSTEARVTWVNALSKRLNDRREPWPKDLWTAFLSAYGDLARELLDAAKTAPAAQAAALRARAQSFIQSRDRHLEDLRKLAQANLESARATKDVRRTHDFIHWGSIQAEVLGDAKLVRAFGRLDTTPRR
jgi:hypothetical protein